MIEAIRELSTSSIIEFAPVNLRHVLDNALNAECEMLKKQSVAVHANLPMDFPAVSGRSILLEIVFINLIKNAREALRDLPAGQKRELHVDGGIDGDQVVIRLRDSGPGMPPEDAAKVFESHFTTKGAGGTGVGLYLCRQIIQNHAGSIDIRNNPGQGAEFIIYLPKAV